MQIYVKNHDFGFWTQEPVNVQRFQTFGDEKELVWCNHQDYQIEKNEITIDRTDMPDISYVTNAWVCRRCGAYQLDQDGYWYEAPQEGVSYANELRG